MKPRKARGTGLRQASAIVRSMTIRVTFSDGWKSRAVVEDVTTPVVTAGQIVGPIWYVNTAFCVLFDSVTLNPVGKNHEAASQLVRRYVNDFARYVQRWCHASFANSVIPRFTAGLGTLLDPCKNTVVAASRCGCHFGPMRVNSSSIAIGYFIS